MFLCVLIQSFRGSVDPFHVNAVDTTGAGDSYVGALLCKIVDDRAVLEVNTKIIHIKLFCNFRLFDSIFDCILFVFAGRSSPKRSA